MYVAMTTHVIYHAYAWPLYSYVSGTTVCTCSHMQRYLYCIVGWLVLPPGSSSLHFWDGLVMYFGHRITLWPHTLGGICYSWFYHTWWITDLWPSLSLYRLFGPHGLFLYLWCFQYHPSKNLLFSIQDFQTHSRVYTQIWPLIPCTSGCVQKAK